MKLELTMQECKWLADIARKAKEDVDLMHRVMPHRYLFELCRENMAELENKINKQIEKETEERDEFTGANPVRCDRQGTKRD